MPGLTPSTFRPLNPHSIEGGVGGVTGVGSGLGLRLNKIEKFYAAGAGKFFVLLGITLEIAEGEFTTVMDPAIRRGKAHAAQHPGDARRHLERRFSRSTCT